jgi:2-dehydropantoate 2-reductase
MDRSAHEFSSATNARQRIAVIGGGAIGCIFADAASDAGHDVMLCVRRPLARIAVERQGVVSVPHLTITANPDAATPVDWVFLATKTQDTAGTAPWFDRLIGPDTKVVLLQNGIDGVAIARPVVGAAPILPSIVYIAAERRAAGRVVHYFGDHIEVPAGALAGRLAETLAGRIAVRPEVDFTTAAWRKLICNAAVNPITALTMQRLGVIARPDVRDLAFGLIRESAAVANADGASLSSKAVSDICDYCSHLTPQGGTSMLYDRLCGNALEYEHLSGTVVRLARRYAIPVPLNAAILALVSALDTAGPAGNGASRAAE